MVRVVVVVGGTHPFGSCDCCEAKGLKERGCHIDIRNTEEAVFRPQYSPRLSY